MELRKKVLMHLTEENKVSEVTLVTGKVIYSLSALSTSPSIHVLLTTSDSFITLASVHKLVTFLEQVGL